MSWSTDPDPPVRRTGPGWSPNPAQPPRAVGDGWFALLEKVAPLNGSGELGAVLVPRYVAQEAPFSGGGELSIALAIRNYRNAILSGVGLPHALAFETRSRTAAFTGDGALDLFLNDGLSAIVQIGYAGRLSGGGALDAIVTGGHPAIDGLSAEVSARLIGVMLPALAGSGALSASALARYPSAAGLTGDGALAATATGTVSGAHYSDDFNRANSSSSLGTSWTNRDNTMGINSNRAYPVTNTSFGECLASYNSAMLTDNMQSTVILGSATGSDQYVYAGIGLSTAGVGVWGGFKNGVTQSQTTVTIYSTTAWGIFSGSTSRVSITNVPVFATGTALTIKRVGNVYTLLRDGVAIAGATWTDSTNIVPRGASNRLVGVGGSNVSNNYRGIDTWTADDI